MALKKCSKCNVMFDATENKDFCSKCEAEVFNGYSEEQKEHIYLKVREFLHENPRTPKTTVAELMNISIKIIDQWIKEGKIEEVEGMVGSTGPQKMNTCTGCGRKISKGILCDYCKKGFEADQGSSNANHAGFKSSVVSK